MTTPTDLRTLADRVEAGKAATAEITCALRWFPQGIRDWMRGGIAYGSLILKPTAHGWVGVYRLTETTPIEAFPSPAWLDSLDAAASIMPDGWWITMVVTDAHVGVLATTAPDRRYSVEVRAPTKCAARVAAALRARAHMMEVG